MFIIFIIISSTSSISSSSNSGGGGGGGSSNSSSSSSGGGGSSKRYARYFNYTPETNRACRVYCVAEIPYLQFMLHVMSFPMLNVLYFYVSTF